MIKKILIIVGILIAAYFAIAGVLTIGGVCPKYINLMPRVVGPDFPADKGTPVWYIFCPFSDKVY